EREPGERDEGGVRLQGPLDGPLTVQLLQPSLDRFRTGPGVAGDVFLCLSPDSLVEVFGRVSRHPFRRRGQHGRSSFREGVTAHRIWEDGEQLSCRDLEW